MEDIKINWMAGYWCAVEGCHRPASDRHHIIHGTKKNKRFSEGNDLLIPLCREHHAMCHHTSAELDFKLKELAQERYLLTHTMDEWMQAVGRNYTDQEV